MVHKVGHADTAISLISKEFEGKWKPLAAIYAAGRYCANSFAPEMRVAAIAESDFAVVRSLMSVRGGRLRIAILESQDHPLRMPLLSKYTHVGVSFTSLPGLWW